MCRVEKVLLGKCGPQAPSMSQGLSLKSSGSRAFSLQLPCLLALTHPQPQLSLQWSRPAPPPCRCSPPSSLLPFLTQGSVDLPWLLHLASAPLTPKAWSWYPLSSLRAGREEGVNSNDPLLYLTKAISHRREGGPGFCFTQEPV